MRTRGAGRLAVVVWAAAALASFPTLPAMAAPGPVPAPTPTPTPPSASDNPEDVRARMPARPTPFHSETKFAPPQQSAEEEELKSNRPVEPDLLHGEPAIFLSGVPFPARRPYDPKFPEARRMRYVSADAAAPGDGSSERPWKDLQEALCRLEPGDRLLIASGIYVGAFRVAGACRDGTAQAPIQVFARHAFLKAAEGGGDVLTIERAHWQIWELQIALLDSEPAGLVTKGAGAHDIAVDQCHIYEGEGPAVRLAAGSDRVTLSNCHIHQSKGVRIEGGASHVTLVNNHIHHNRAASVTVGGGGASGPARDVTIEGNRIHNDHGPALELSSCDGLSASRNRFSNYRPDPEEGRTGEAIVVGPGSRRVRLAENSILEASVAVRVRGGSGSGDTAEQISFDRNYLENTLTAESTAFSIEAGRRVRIANNIVDRYADPIRIGPGASAIWVANNLILHPDFAFRVGSLRTLALFDYNVFGADPSLKAEVGSEPVGAAAWMKAHMPHSRVVPEAGFSDGDLGKIVGFTAVDAGKPVEGVPFRGRAPDIGVDDR